MPSVSHSFPLTSPVQPAGPSEVFEIKFGPQLSAVGSAKPQGVATPPQAMAGRTTQGGFSKLTCEPLASYTRRTSSPNERSKMGRYVGAAHFEVLRLKN